MAFLKAQRRVPGAHGGRWLAVMLGLFGALAAAESRPPPSAPLHVKAAFLLNFAAFVTWPETAFADANAPVVVGVYGADPFGAVLDDVLAGEAVSGRPFLVRRIPRGGDAGGCHILFVSESERGRMAAVLRAVRQKPVLTVADGAEFVAAGGMIGFVVERGRIRFRINQDAAKGAGITISSRLLRLAQGSPER